MDCGVYVVGVGMGSDFVPPYSTVEGEARPITFSSTTTSFITRLLAFVMTIHLAARALPQPPTTPSINSSSRFSSALPPPLLGIQSASISPRMLSGGLRRPRPELPNEFTNNPFPPSARPNPSWLSRRAREKSSPSRSYYRHLQRASVFYVYALA